MSKYLVICGTNRNLARTRVVAQAIHEIISESHEVSTIDLLNLPDDFGGSSMYNGSLMSGELLKWQEDLLIPADKWVLVSPEYNGAFPGVLKTFLDALSVRKAADTFHKKKVLLVGVADGRAGNLRGMEYLTGILNYLKMNVYPNKLPISQISKLLNASQDKFTDESTLKTLNTLLNEFYEF